MIRPGYGADGNASAQGRQIKRTNGFTNIPHSTAMTYEPDAKPKRQPPRALTAALSSESRPAGHANKYSYELQSSKLAGIATGIERSVPQPERYVASSTPGRVPHLRTDRAPLAPCLC